MSKPSFVYVIYIASTPQKVWDALTQGDLTRQYWDHRNESDWKVGSRWEHQRLDDSATADVFGNVVESVPPHKLVVTWDHPGNRNGAAEASRVTYAIEPILDDVRLTVTHEDLEPGSKMLEGVSKGWPAVLCSLKSFLETGHGLEMIKNWKKCNE